MLTVVREVISVNGTVLGIIAPHPPIMVLEVGGVRAGVTADSTEAMDVAHRALTAFDPDVIVLMSPHAPVVRDAFVIDTSEVLTGDLGAFGAGNVRITTGGDSALAEAIISEATASGIPIVPRSASPALDPGLLDHGALVPLSFLDRESRYPLVELSLAFLPLATHRSFGAAIRRATERLGRRTVFIASGDCSHRLTRDAPAGFSVHGAEFDAELLRVLGTGAFDELEHIEPSLIEAAGECGLRSFITLGGFLGESDVHTRVLSYEGPWGVGYLTALSGSPALLAHLGTPDRGVKGGMPGATESAPVDLARRTIGTYVRERRVITEPPSEGLLASRHGAFVSLHRAGMLRGCIGTIAPTQPTLADEIIHNAIQAATADPRFPPLGVHELDDLEISVDVLQPPEPATQEDLDPRVFGVIVSADWRRGLLLPDLEGVDSAEEQIAIARQKAGIGPGENVNLERFRVDRYH